MIELIASLIIIIIVSGILTTKLSNKKTTHSKKKTKETWWDKELPHENEWEYFKKQEKHFKDKKETWLKRKLLTDNELRCFQALNQCIDKDENISCKVRLADLIEPEKKLTQSEWHSQFNKIKSKHIDFVITNKKTMDTIVAIELDDSSHRRSDRMKRDDFVNDCLESANIKLLRLNSYKTYMPELIKNKIQALVTS